MRTVRNNIILYEVRGRQIKSRCCFYLFVSLLRQLYNQRQTVVEVPLQSPFTNLPRYVRVSDGLFSIKGTLTRSDVTNTLRQTPYIRTETDGPPLSFGVNSDRFHYSPVSHLGCSDVVVGLQLRRQWPSRCTGTRWRRGLWQTLIWVSTSKSFGRTEIKEGTKTDLSSILQGLFITGHQYWYRMFLKVSLTLTVLHLYSHHWLFLATRRFYSRQDIQESGLWDVSSFTGQFRNWDVTHESCRIRTYLTMFTSVGDEGACGNRRLRGYTIILR